MEGIYRIEWTPPPLLINRQVAAKTIVQRPHRDLIPWDTWLRWFGNKTQVELGFPVAQIYQDRRPTVKGVLVRASEWNPPEGCLRVISEDEYSFVRTQQIANSHDDLQVGDTEKTWLQNIEDMQAREYDDVGMDSHLLRFLSFTNCSYPVRRESHGLLMLNSIRTIRHIRLRGSFLLLTLSSFPV